jgi:hypothetical protein
MADGEDMIKEASPRATDGAATSSTRDLALAQGELVDISAHARDFLITFPVAITREAWDLTVAVNPAAKRRGDTEADRVSDVVWMLLFVVRRMAKDGATVPFVADFGVMCMTPRARIEFVRLRAVVDDDAGATVATVMLPR